MNNSPAKKLNRLAMEKSPYLLQHATNPVDWFPWGKEAFEKAEKEDKPVFLSIGYSTCHWCHVMERESFEDAEVAGLMNETFICIKVDREERPDIDRAYMAVCRMMTGGGGWPLTIMMTPEKKPFFAGTYIPRENRFNQTGLLELIPRIRETWLAQRENITEPAEAAAKAAMKTSSAAPGQIPAESLLEDAFTELSRYYDESHGGFGEAPKFPSPSNLLFLLRYWKRTGNRNSLDMVAKTLDMMRSGGIYDQIGFGFHRYSTDREWRVPHFEKMLYDQAMLIMAYTEAWQATGKDKFKQTARETCAYVLREMTSPDGGFYSAEDADSEGKEGLFYTWTEAQIRQALPGGDVDLAMDFYGIVPGGNSGEESPAIPEGSSILRLVVPRNRAAGEPETAGTALNKRLESIKEKLVAARQKRIHPDKDDKILTDWNGLMIAALAKAARAFDAPQYAAAAARAADFIIKTMRGRDNRLLHRYRDGEAAINAFLDDYAFLTWGLIELYETTFNLRYLQAAMAENTVLLEHFLDKRNGGFYFTADGAEEPRARLKEIYDSEIPSGNAVGMLNLLRLGRMSGNMELLKKADDLYRAFSHAAVRAPAACPFFMAALDFAMGPSYEIVVAGDSGDARTRDILREIDKSFVPNAVVMLRRNELPSPDIDNFSAFTQHQPAVAGKTMIYVCANGACSRP
ncbi:MAG: thioredoxin domain-containing protein, partial [Kiritimatiellia bacterium]